MELNLRRGAWRRYVRELVYGSAYVFNLTSYRERGSGWGWGYDEEGLEFGELPRRGGSQRGYSDGMSAEDYGDGS
eukprot:scaffold1785_cov193-Alexandrium_tamarense.AAC.3